VENEPVSGDATAISASIRITNTTSVPAAAYANSTAGPAAVFEFLLASSGAIALLVYLVIAVSQLRMRQKRTAAGEKIVFKMWLFPGLTYAVMVFIVGTLTIMLFQEAHRIEIIATGVLSLLVVAAGLFVSSRRKTQRAGAAVLN
jgi:GABA permease